MSHPRLKWVRELMIDGQYDAARALLDTLDRDTAALLLRAELEELAPQSDDDTVARLPSADAKNGVPTDLFQVGAPFLASVSPTHTHPSPNAWEYSELAWRITSFTEGIPGSYALADAILHRFSLISRDYAALDPHDLAVSSIDFRVGKPLDTFGETDTNTLASRLGSAPEEIARFYQEQPEAFRATQTIILSELNTLLEMAARAQLAQLGAEGWEWIAVRERAPDAWADLHDNVRIALIELCSVYYLKRRL
jgi:hypothetical protein